MAIAAYLTAATLLSAIGWPSPGLAGPPVLGSPEGELLCAGWTNVLASGAMLTTGADAATAIRAHGIFIGRLSMVAPEAKYRLRDYLRAYDKMTPSEQAQLGESCLAKLKEIDGIGGSRADDKSP